MRVKALEFELHNLSVFFVHLYIRFSFPRYCRLIIKAQNNGGKRMIE